MRQTTCAGQAAAVEKIGRELEKIGWIGGILRLLSRANVARRHMKQFEDHSMIMKPASRE